MDIENFAMTVLISTLVYNILSMSKNRLLFAIILFAIGFFYTYRQVKGGNK